MDWKLEGRKAKLAALLLVAAVVVAGLAWMALRPRTDEAPLFRLDAIGEGNQTLDLAAQRGKVVVLDLMAVNCAACRTLTQDVLKPIYAEHGNGTDVVLWSVDVWAGGVGETEENLLALQVEEGSQWAHALDDGTIFDHYEPPGLPVLLIVDPAGRVTFNAGAPDLPALSSVQEAIAEARTGSAPAVGIPQTGLAGLALLAGAAAVFSPCSIGLLPAYFGMLLRQGKGPGPVQGGLQATAGVVLMYGAIATLLVPFGGAIVPMLSKLGIFMGVLFILLGIAMLAGFDWGRLTAPLRRRMPSNEEGKRGYWFFGFGYALASFGCTGPIFLLILVQAFGGGPFAGFGAFVLYAAGVALFLVFIALLAAVGADGPLRWLASKSVWVARVVAVVWIGAGAYLVYYDVNAYGLPW